MAGPAVRVEASAGALRVVLDRPERGNSLDLAVLADLHRALDQAERTDGCRLVLLEGSGGVFSTGMDLATAGREESSMAAAAEEGGRAFYGLLRRFTESSCIVVSLVDGRVAGGGVGLVAASDLVSATERSSFGLPEAIWGLLPCCVLPFLIRRVGFQPAYAMALSTLPVSAPDALRSRLVDAVADDPSVLVRRLAGRVRRMDDHVVRDMKRYFSKLRPLSDATERVAVDELVRLMSSPSVRSRIEDFATRQALPETR
jgi:polyketide biosynthesis enoyl-CoA hydratase PksH